MIPNGQDSKHPDTYKSAPVRLILVTVIRFADVCGTKVHLPIDNKTNASKGFAYINYKNPMDAVEAFKHLDKKIFQGRLLHILPAAPKRENKFDEYALSKLPLKKQRELRRKASAATTQFNWNSMYMNVINSGPSPKFRPMC